MLTQMRVVCRNSFFALVTIVLTTEKHTGEAERLLFHERETMELL